MATLKLKKSAPGAASAPRGHKDDRPPVRGTGNLARPRPTLAQAQTQRAEREERYQEQLRQRFGDKVPAEFRNRPGEGQGNEQRPPRRADDARGPQGGARRSAPDGRTPQASFDPRGPRPERGGPRGPRPEGRDERGRFAGRPEGRPDGRNEGRPEGRFDNRRDDNRQDGPRGPRGPGGEGRPSFGRDDRGGQRDERGPRNDFVPRSGPGGSGQAFGRPRGDDGRFAPRGRDDGFDRGPNPRFDPRSEGRNEGRPAGHFDARNSNPGGRFEGRGNDQQRPQQGGYGRPERGGPQGGPDNRAFGRGPQQGPGFDPRQGGGDERGPRGGDFRGGEFRGPDRGPDRGGFQQDNRGEFRGGGHFQRDERSGGGSGGGFTPGRDKRGPLAPARPVQAGGPAAKHLQRGRPNLHVDDDEDDDFEPQHDDAPDAIRLSKRMSALGLASRREADEWIAKGWVRVDGRVVNELGSRVLPEQRITIDARGHLQQANRVTVVINKPMGYVSGQAEDGHEPAYVLVKPENQWQEDQSGTRFLLTHLRNLVPAGRLDIDSVGLLVLTQDGRVAKQLIGETSEIEKEYLVRVESTAGERLSDEGMALLRHGLELDDEPLLPAHVEWVNEDQLRFVLKEGKKRQIRRMCEAVGLKVVGLKRVRIGKVMLGDLPTGQWRYLRADEAF
jgi:23S rRNA pseudouridine2604 synthase